MKLAILMTVYNSPDLANTFIKQLIKSEDTHVFVHVDKKFDEIKKDILKHDRVHIISNNIKVEWGNFTHVQSILNMAEYAKSLADFDYYSINSGQDLLVRPIEEAITELESRNKLAYLDCCKLPIAQWGAEGGMDRVKYRWPKFLVRRIGPKSPYRIIRHLFVVLSKHHLIKLNRLPQGIEWYGGSDWFTVRKDGMEEILRVSKEDKALQDVFLHSFIGSELYFNTILCNMGRNNEIAMNDNLRYIDWENREEGQAKGSPKTLRISDINAIVASKKIFARKFTLQERKLIDEIVQITN